MLLKVKGLACNINEPIIGYITRDVAKNDKNFILIAEENIPQIGTFSAILTQKYAESTKVSNPTVLGVSTFEHLSEGDIVCVNSDGVINTLYRVNSYHNSLLTTERCNSNCLMCSQPPKDRNDIPYLMHIHKKLIPLIPKNCMELGITGGEPTLLGNDFFELLSLIKHELPETEVHCLTNGRTFAWKNIAKNLGEMEYRQLMLGVPIYSDYYQLHDYIVQAQNAFNQTILGLYNLAEQNVRIEIRIVLHKLTIPRLVKLAKYIYKNLPFVEHIAFMGLENQGYTPHNINKLWIEPAEYMNQLAEAIEYLDYRGLNVSIYNTQLCILPKNLWTYARKSISDWKNIYLDECKKCSLKEDCGGLFLSSKDFHSKYIQAIE